VLQQAVSNDLLFSTLKGESIPFSIGDSSVIIDIIRKKIYSYPIRTLVQEYLSNARDSCIEAGKDASGIEVGLPTSFVPEFVVRDYGVGMSDERVREVFVRYGISTKRESTSQLGYFGIGAKSGWSYSDSFIVESYYDGIVREYVADIGENKEGRLLQYRETPTTAGNGVKIRIPCNPDDCRNFLAAYERATFLWDTRPSVNNARYPGLVLDLGSLRIFKGNLAESMPIVLDAAGIPFVIENNELRHWCRSHNFILAIKADPAKMNISANREGFSNAEYGEQLLKKAKQTLTDYVHKSFNEAPLIEYRKIISDLSTFRLFINFRTKGYLLTEGMITLINKGYFHHVQYRKPAIKCLAHELIFANASEVFLCRSKMAHDPSPEAARALKVAKSENIKESRIFVFFQQELSDTDYQHIAGVVGATRYLEDVYASKKPVKVAKYALRKPEKLYVQPFYIAFRSRHKVTRKHPKEVDSFTGDAIIFYGEDCPKDVFRFLESIKLRTLIPVYATKNTIKKIEEIQDPRWIPIENWKATLEKDHVLLQHCMNMVSYIEQSPLRSIICTYGKNLVSSKFDFNAIGQRLSTLSSTASCFHTELYRKFFKYEPTDLDKILTAYPLLGLISGLYIKGDMHTKHINIYIKAMEEMP